MRYIRRTICLILAAAILLLSCDGNVFVTPDISYDVDATVKQVERHLDKEIKAKLISLDLRTFITGIVKNHSEDAAKLTDDELDALMEFLIPDENNITIEYDITKIPPIEKVTMDSLLYLEKPQDIALVNHILSSPLKQGGNAAIATADLYKYILVPLFRNNSTATEQNGLIAFSNVLTVPDEENLDTLTYGDYMAVQMILTLVLDTIPSAIVENYTTFVPEVEENRMTEYIASIADNLIRALVVNDSTIRHILGTYTFLNKYNPSTTILNMKNLGSFFSTGEEF